MDEACEARAADRVSGAAPFIHAPKQRIRPYFLGRVRIGSVVVLARPTGIRSTLDRVAASQDVT